MNQKATPEQMEEMSYLMALSEHEELVKVLLFKAYQTPKTEVDIDPGKSEAILQAIYQVAPVSKKSVKLSSIKPFLPQASVAAAVLFCLTIGILFFTPKREELPQTAIQHKHPIVSGGNKAMLILADGSKVVLDDKHTGKVASQGSVLITKTANGQLTYSHAASAVPADGDNIIETPRGGQYQVTLPDGTEVWLNAASRLKYPVAFKAGERRVELQGEAYFEVAKNKKLPFRVVSNGQTVEVLGTHFNINSYKEEGLQRTTLLEGSVRVLVLKNMVLLKPGQQAEVSKNESIAITEANTEAAIAWKNGYFRFDHEGIESIMSKISRWYDVSVEFKGKITEEKFSGTSSRAKNINQVLEMLEETNAVHFKIEGRRILVMK
ncbi:DUF4974 domain-containing protein [Pedobacter sp. PLR]|uniref:FecR family protein n=1 Tax=Pedobacter sp. PLR TaxID=2994465 RepID=UPI002247E670|nr:FecR family protein [Pedobacter sp. PLR]MCX2452084.1 DUF4974 domain-containing protein [Pedobacter sp. PLR]